MGQGKVDRWQVGDLLIDVGAHAVTRGGEPIYLPRLSFNFLVVLIEAAPNVLTVEELIERVWPGIFISVETVTQRAKLLRDALGDDPKEPRYFAVRRGVGYQLLPPAVRLSPAAAPVESASRKRRIIQPVLALLLVGVAVLGTMAIEHIRDMPDLFEGRPNSAVVRVAVLAFENLSSDPADAFIARSIPEMVLDRLSSARGVTVIARDSALLSLAATVPAGDAGKRLRADFVVKGSIQRAGGILRVTCFVVDTRTEARVWSERFDWPVGRIYALQDRIADRVVASLKGRTRIGPLPLRARAASGADAYLAYLKGKSLLSRFTINETDAAAVLFEKAVQLDPTFPDAIVALFDARMQAADLRKDELGPFRARYGPLLDKALRIDPDAGPALFAKAMWSEQQFEMRLRLFRRAAQLDPSNSRGLTAYAEFLDRLGSDAMRGTGEHELEARRLISRVLAIDPLSSRARWWSIQRRWTTIPPAQLEQEMARELQVDPQNYALALFYARSRWFVHGQTAEAIDQIERIIAVDPQQPLGPNAAVGFYLDVNDPAAARAIGSTTPASRETSGILLAQYQGDWQAAGSAALAMRRFPFNLYQTLNWSEAVRDYALQTRQYDVAVKAIAARYGFDLNDPHTIGPPQVNTAAKLAQILMAKGEHAKAARLLAQTVQWIDTHPSYGMAYHMRARAEAMMLLGERSEALSNLRAAFETGHDIRHWWYVVDSDPIWVPVHDHPRFQEIASLCREAARAQRAKLEELRQSGKVPQRLAASTSAAE